jgi:hypothetical protein
MSRAFEPEAGRRGRGRALEIVRREGQGPVLVAVRRLTAWGRRQVPAVRAGAGTSSLYASLPPAVSPAAFARQESKLGTRLRRPVLTAHLGFPSTLQSHIQRLQPPRVALVDPGSSHEPLHDGGRRILGWGMRHRVGLADVLLPLGQEPPLDSLGGDAGVGDWRRLTDGAVAATIAAQSRPKGLAAWRPCQARSGPGRRQARQCGSSTALESHTRHREGQDIVRGQVRHVLQPNRRAGEHLDGDLRGAGLPALAGDSWFTSADPEGSWTDGGGHGLRGP